MVAMVTGAGGFLGKHLVDELVSRGRKVRAMVRSTPSVRIPGVEYFVGDITDRKIVEIATANVEEVFHVAARVGIWGPYQEFYRVNVLGTENVIRGCIKNHVRKLIYTSSPSVVFDGKAQSGGDEEYRYPKRHLNPYSETKRLAEERVLSIHDSKALSTIVLRPHLIWGRGDRYLFPRIIEQAKQRKLFRVGDGKNRVDLIHVQNAVSAHLLATDVIDVRPEVGGKAYFVSQGAPVNLWDFINEVVERSGAPKISRSISFDTAYRIGSVMETGYRIFRKTGEPKMTRFLAQSLALDHFYSLDRARRDLGFAPTFTVQQGLDDFFR